SPAISTNIELTIRNESDTSPPAVGERMGEGELSLLQLFVIFPFAAQQQNICPFNFPLTSF
ncbi:MAG: hypothetical protein IKH64_03260, partial [Prevotella sp.]|nr:hypothetical protein [Prevotella sp.]